MSKPGIWITRIIAVLLMVLGVILGTTWARTGVCFGDEIFAVLGLPVWSNEIFNTGTHYPAISGIVIILIGACALNVTLEDKERRWAWGCVILALVLLKLFFSRA